MSAPCRHQFVVYRTHVEATYTKGVRGSFSTIGDYYECNFCFEGQFRPHDPQLSTVGCEYEPPDYKMTDRPKTDVSRPEPLKNE